MSYMGAFFACYSIKHDKMVTSLWLDWENNDPRETIQFIIERISCIQLVRLSHGYTDWVWFAILCHLLQYEYKSRVHKPVYEAKGDGVPGSIRILGQVTQFWQNILNLYYSTGPWKLFWDHLTGILCQREVVGGSWKRRPVARSPSYNPILLQLPILPPSMTLTDMGWKLNSTRFVVIFTPD